MIVNYTGSRLENFKKEFTVCFNFDGDHNKSYVLSILSLKLKHMEYFIENKSHENKTIYVRANEPKEKIFYVCYGIQCNCTYI